MNKEFDEEIILNTQEETTTTPQEEVETDGSSEESVEDLRARLAKAEELASNYKIRAEKAEKKPVKVETQKIASGKSSELSAIDIIAISKANIEAEDVEDVLEYARFKGISLSEALKSPVVRATISHKEETRKTAQASNTGTARRGSTALSDSQLLENARKGIMPESDADLRRLVTIQRKH